MANKYKPDDYKGSGLSKGAYEKKYGKSSSSKKSSSKKSSSSDDIQKLVDKAVNAVLDVTPADQKTAADFESTIYTPEVQAEDLTQAKALFEPFYTQKIDLILEDLQHMETTAAVSYDRTLRRARASMAAAGGAIGTERENNEKEMDDQYQDERRTRIKSAESSVGTENINKIGLGGLTGSTQEGNLVAEMKSSIADQVLWYKNQRAQRYYGDVGTYYQQSPGVSITGKTL